MKVVIITVLVLLTYLYLNNNLDRRKANIDSKLLGFVENAHEAYIKSYEIEDVTPFAKYASTHVMIELRERIEYGEHELYGVRRYRDRKVSLVDSKDTYVKVRISLTHQHIKIKRGISIAIGDDITAIWQINTDGKKYKVVEIT